VAGCHVTVINNPAEEDPAKREYKAEIVEAYSEEDHYHGVLYEAAEDEKEDWPEEAEWEGGEWPEEVDPWGVDADADASTTTNANTANANVAVAAA
jgi:hypothetical protein